MTYIHDNQYIKCVCRSGDEFIIDADDYDKIQPYNWFWHNGRVEGNVGGKGRRVTLGRVIIPDLPAHVAVRQHILGNDYTKINLYLDNEFIDKGDYYEVITRRGTFLIDKDDKVKIDKWHWRINTHRYAEAVIDGRCIQLHRYIMGLSAFSSYDEVIDHINRDRLDNRKINLRVVDQKTNINNADYSSRSTSGIPGVYYDKHIKKWRGQYRDGEKIYNLGLHETKESIERERDHCIQCLLNGREYQTPRHNLSQTGERYIYKLRNGYVVKTKDKYVGFNKDFNQCLLMKRNANI